MVCTKNCISLGVHQRKWCAAYTTARYWVKLLLVMLLGDVSLEISHPGLLGAMSTHDTFHQYIQDLFDRYDEMRCLWSGSALELHQHPFLVRVRCCELWLVLEWSSLTSITASSSYQALGKLAQSTILLSLN